MNHHGDPDLECGRLGLPCPAVIPPERWCPPCRLRALAAGVVRARDAYATDPTHEWCARGCFNLARVGAYCCDYCRDTRPHRRRDPE